MKKIKLKIKGAATIEFVILTPLMIITFLVMLYFLFISISYVEYNNLANHIAQDLNMRQTGYSDVYDEPVPSFSFAQGGGKLDEEDKTSYLNAYKTETPITDVTIETNNNSNDKLLKASFYSINKNIDEFYIPGAICQSIYIEATKNGSPLTSYSDSSMSGAVIKVTIDFTSFGLPFTAHGYNIII